MLRRGAMRATHPLAAVRRAASWSTNPPLLFYPQPLAHDFHNAPQEGSDFVCATLDFDGGSRHPLVQALPPLVALPVAALPDIEHTLALLFAETEHCALRPAPAGQPAL